MKIENKKNVVSAPNETVLAFVKHATTAARASVKASHAGAWAIAVLMEDGETLDEAFVILKDALAGEKGFTAKERSSAINGVRVWVPAAVAFLASRRHDTCPAKAVWPSLKRVKAVHGEESPSEATFNFAEKQVALVEKAKESLAEAGNESPSNANIEEQMIAIAPRKSGTSGSGSTPLARTLAFISTANVVDIQSIHIALNERQKSINAAQAATAAALKAKNK